MLHALDNLKFSAIGLDVPKGHLSNGRTYRKQIAYAGTFGHYDQATGATIQQVDITEADIDHWATSVKSQVSDGFAIPIQDTHEETSDPTKCHGYVIDAEIGKDSKGRYSLFVVCEFADEEKAKALAKVSDVSLYQPPSAVSGANVRYTRPLRHVMLTTKPVVPGLDKFVALSIPPSKKSSKPMIKLLALALGITFADDATEETVSGLIQAEVGILRQAAKPIAQSSVPVTKPSAGVVKLITRSRASQLSELVTSQRITPAMKASLEKTFAEGATIAFSADASGDFEDPIFDGVILALSAIPSLALTGKQAPNVGTPAKSTDEEPDVLGDLMRARAAKAAKS